ARRARARAARDRCRPSPPRPRERTRSGPHESAFTSRPVGMVDYSGTMAHQPITSINDPRYVKAISHPLRVRILAMLQERTASPSQLSEWLGATLGTTAYHVRALHKLGLIELADETRV